MWVFGAEPAFAAGTGTTLCAAPTAGATARRNATTDFNDMMTTASSELDWLAVRAARRFRALRR